MSITLEGLTKQQRQIADLLWRCDTQEAVEQLKSSMPQQYRKDAETVHQLMIAAVMDQYETVDDYTENLIRDISHR